MCLAQGPQCSDADEAGIRGLRYQVKHSTTEPLAPDIIPCGIQKNILVKFGEILTSDLGDGI